MAYQINKTDGTVISTVADGQIDTLSTDITLIGKNYSGFGEALNENFIKILENFASTSRPTSPIRGQIWFDAAELKLKVYSGTEFLPVSSATIANTQPLTLGVGDLWFNNVDSQLYFFDGTIPILLGPSYSTSQGLSGVKVASILDTLNQTRVITYLYTNGILLGIFSKDSFTPKNAIIGYTGSVNPGFNAGNLEGLKFNVTATNAENLGGVISTTYVRKDTSNTMSGQLTITTDLGVVLGEAGQANLKVNSGNVTLSNASTDNDLILNVRRGIDQEDAIRIQSATRTILLYPGSLTTPVPEINVGGNLTIEGNLIVNGTTTTVNTATLTIEDKNIELASGSNSNDESDGGGITLRGEQDHTLIWTNSSRAWNSSEHLNLVTSDSVPEPEYKINGVTVINRDTAFVSNFPNVNQLGTQLSITVGPYPGGEADPQLRLEDNRISTVKAGLDLELEPIAGNNVTLIGSPRITGLADPLPGDEHAQDAATREYVDNVIETRSLLFSTDLTDGKSNGYIISNILNNLAPVADYRIGTTAKILCTLLSNSTTSLDINSLVTESRATFTTPTGTAQALTNVEVNTATISGSSISTTRIIKEFQLEALGIAPFKAWQHVSDTLLPP
jgi:hypothetical protein